MNTTEIPIAKPCTADWSAMTLADRGRFCGECRKVVRELTQLSEREARALLASPPTEGLCVRYLHDAKGEIVFRKDGLVPVTRLVRLSRSAAAALAIALPLGASACSATGEPMRTGQPEMAVDVMPMMGAPPPPASLPDADAGAPGTVLETR